MTTKCPNCGTLDHHHAVWCEDRPWPLRRAGMLMAIAAASAWACIAYAVLVVI